jgi:hypothetical protein
LLIVAMFTVVGAAQALLQNIASRLSGARAAENELARMLRGFMFVSIVGMINTPCRLARLRVITFSGGVDSGRLENSLTLSFEPCLAVSNVEQKTFR